ncbi:glycosyltransferase family 2 protein [Bacillus thuringiensis]|uniref:Glycosyltransferase family 2 protein n=1 Tax=Bacillus cereus TaxID=1396 RepID=A0A9W7Q5G7_BACCE|nr:glycosyltransferase family 2 protein [Bacillus cereus]KAA6467043.1 glycosyltransferase family 2 protein [Bacillus cereus]KAB2505669.1 glycosyltransferase family 2 protein [Bacillus cereus]MED3329083.1 glycosyltransferase family 2 protein [Bacillus thuringiensis]
MNLISVIVPVYNIEKYLPKCLNSLLQQSYNNLEIILVDDGSSDNSAHICEEYAGKDNRIYVIHKKNGGVSSARNEGLKRATGDFIVFIDGDDIIEANAFDLMLQNIIEYQSDICVCDSYFSDGIVYSNGTILQENNVLTKEEVLEMHLKFSFIASLCFCMFKKEVLTDLYLNTHIHAMEDWEYLFRIIDKSNTISICHKTLYHYMLHEGSASKSRINDRKLTALKIAPITEKYVSEKIPGLIDYVSDMETRLVLHLLVVAANADTTEEKHNKLFTEIIRRNFKKSLKSKHLLKRQKMYIIMTAFSARVYYFFYYLKYWRKK